VVESIKLFLFSLFAKYITLAYNFGENDFANNILNEIIVRAIKENKSGVLEYFEMTEHYDPAFIRKWNSIGFDSVLIEHFFTRASNTNKFISKEVRIVEDSLYNLWQIRELYEKK
jgi:hypothetical protein